MIALDKYYNISVEDIEYIEIKDNTNTPVGHPYELTVYLKSGRSCSVYYSDSKSRDREKYNMINRLDYERRERIEKISTMLTILKKTVETIDRRQLRIWRQLKALLNVSIEEE